MDIGALHSPFCNRHTINVLHDDDDDWLLPVYAIPVCSLSFVVLNMRIYYVFVIQYSVMGKSQLKSCQLKV